ncbi:hypothetical protein PRUB_a5393 [Pseudoalteromonas rubra]|uniref:Uncharacterized protein n=2 Tax=Pseudoalteromonas rubra TaxID=43658 RepID=A0A8T0CCL5_9GAMM|nr:hypothetical protein PRUB_a5393 [Pseudoalteromonas rubra]
MQKSDGYCLDGNRLLLVSGTYGAANSTYRTELSNFMTIKAIGTDSSNTCLVVLALSCCSIFYRQEALYDKRITALCLFGH